MYTYFFTNNVNNLVKIGKSIAPRSRSLQTAGECTFIKITVFHTIEGDYESEFHLLFSSYRVCGEWFDIPDFSVELLNEKLSYILVTDKKLFHAEK